MRSATCPGCPPEARKAAYLDFQRDSDLEMEFFIAEQLGMSVARLRSELSSDEFVRWQVYFGRKAQRRELDGNG